MRGDSVTLVDSLFVLRTPNYLTPSTPTRVAQSSLRSGWVPDASVRIPPSHAKHNRPTYSRRAHCFAETQGFEPWRAFRPCLVSSEVLSTTQPRLQYLFRLVGDVASFHSRLPCYRIGNSFIRTNG